MEYRRLGASGLEVSPICLGTMMFGARTGAKAAGRIVDHARAAGVNFIDTADGYAKGESERIVGKAISRDRDDWVLATKVGNPRGGPNRRGLGAKWIARGCDESLARLGTDYLDIYYFHLDDEATPLEESLGAVARLIELGKVRYYGISNYFGWRIALLCSTADAMGLPLPVACQPYYNAMDRTPERDVLPACAHWGLGVVPYSPLARGVLTGKYVPGEAPAKTSRAGAGDARMLQTEFRTESLKIAQRIKRQAEKSGMTPGQWAFNWVLANPNVSSVLAGPRTLRQWKDYLSALDHADKWTAKDDAFLDRLVAPGHPSTPGYNDPKYPIRGRE